MERLLPLAEHTPGEWEVTAYASEEKKGEQVQKCTVCGEVLKTEESTMTYEDVKQAYIAKCSSYSFDQIARNPEEYRGKDAVIRGEVIQVEEGWNLFRMRVDITPVSYGWTDTIYVNCRRGLNGPKILEGDVVTFYGKLNGTYTYTAILGQKVTLPYLDADYYQIEY